MLLRYQTVESRSFRGHFSGMLLNRHAYRKEAGAPTGWIRGYRVILQLSDAASKRIMHADAASNVISSRPVPA